jgi:cell division initiation protein
MPLTPVEVRHIQLKRGMFGYRKSAVHQMMDDIADSFENVWRERSELVERVEELEVEVSRHVELEGLLRSTLVSAEKASRDLREAARKEADVIVTEANAEARKVLRDAITEKEQLMSDVHRIQAVLRSALNVITEAPSRGAAPVEAVSAAASIPAPAVEPLPTPPAIEAAPRYEAPAAGWTETHVGNGPVESVAYESSPPEAFTEEAEEAIEEGSMAEWPIGGRTSEDEPFHLPSAPESQGEIRKLAG